jgi:hypothetical protein
MRKLSQEPRTSALELKTHALIYSYTTDCTPDGSRAKIFSTMQAMLNIGMASGPWVSPCSSSYLVCRRLKETPS